MNYTQYKKLPNRLRLIRTEKHLKPKDVAEILGLKFTSQLSQWESGRSMPTLISALRLAGAYRVMVEDLYLPLFRKTREEIAPKAQEVYDRVHGRTASESTGANAGLTK